MKKQLLKISVLTIIFLLAISLVFKISLLKILLVMVGLAFLLTAYIFIKFNKKERQALFLSFKKDIAKSAKSGNMKFIVIIAFFVGTTLIVNLVLAIISTYLPVEFLKPAEIIEAPVSFYSLVIGHYRLNINQTIVNSWVLMILITIILYLGTKKLSIENPGKLQIILEDYYHFIENNFLANFREYKKNFVAFFAALFSFILFSNLSVFLFPFIFMWEREDNKILVKPFFRTATADLNTTFGLAIIVTIVFVSIAIKKKGIFGILRELSRPFIFMFPINLIGEFAKPINISMRLFGNMFAGLVIMGLLYGISFNNVLGSWTGDVLKGSFSFAVVWPSFLQLYLDLFIGILQAFVFTVLSSVYIQQSLIDEED